MNRQGRGFPLEYYPGEILTDTEARINRKMFFLSSMNVGGFLAPNVSVMLPTPTTINIIQSNTLDSIGVQTRNIPFIAPVISNRPDKIIYTDEQIDELYQIAGKFINGSISMEEAMLKLRGGGKFKDISFIVL